MRNKKPIIGMLIIYIFIFIFGLILLLPYAQKQLSKFFEWNTSLVLPLFLSVTLSLLFFSIKLVYYLSKDKSKENNRNYYGSDSLSGKQEYLEREIAELNRRLVASEDKWIMAYHLLLSSQSRQTDLSGVISTSQFLKEFGIDVDNISIKSNMAFVLTPFHPDYMDSYNDICEVCNMLKLTAMRSDEEYIRTDILKHIIKCIVEARVIIANIDSRNANVFYELGIAHALNKPTILISRINTSVPFDIQGQYIVLYDSSHELKMNLHDVLLKMLTSGKDC